MGKLTANYRYQLVSHSDARIRIMNEIIQGIQTIKIYAWEKPFAKIVDKIRRYFSDVFTQSMSFFRTSPLLL